jgi:hypothetical protein
MPDGVSTTGVVGPLAEMVTASPGKPFKAIDEVGSIECAGGRVPVVAMVSAPLPASVSAVITRDALHGGELDDVTDDSNTL